MKYSILKYICISGLVLLSCNLYSQAILTINSPQPTGDYIARDKIIALPGSKFIATSTAKSHLYIDNNIILPTTYSSGGANGTNPISYGLDLSRPVGSIPYSYNVTPIGSAACNIPIFMPSGTNGMIPNISISYSSLNPMGQLGTGWDISGISSISRSAQTIYHNGKVKAIELTNNDAFNLDGNRLVPINGTNGAANTVYATESETFSRITSYNAIGNGPGWFKVETKEGITIEYGNTTDSKLVPVGQTTVLDWKINKMYDTHGNYILFNYNNLNGESFIREIQYTGNSAAGISPYNSVKFYYDYKEEQNSTFVNGGELNHSTLLRAIEIKAEGQLAKQYDFKYSQYHVNSYLTEIVEKGSDNSVLNPLKLSYGTDNIASTSVDITKTSTTVNPYKSENVFLDFNGDGKKDLIGFNYDLLGTAVYWFNWMSYKNIGNSTFQSTSAPKSFPTGFEPFDAYPTSTGVSGNMIYEAVDFNGDSKEDLMLLTVSGSPSSSTKTLSFYQYISNGITFDAPSSPISVTVNNNYKYWYADVNGDRKMDLMVYSFVPASTSDLYIYYGSNSQSDYHASYTGANSPNLINAIVLDIDGDGVSEFANIKYPPGGPSGNYLINFTSGVPTLTADNSSTNYMNLNYFVSSSTGIIYMDDPFCLFGDFNGDGKSDNFNYKSTSATAGDWALGLGKGNGNYKNINLNNEGFPELTNNKFYLTHDINGDGKTDILEFQQDPTTYITTNNVNVYYSTGLSFIPESFVIDLSSFSGKIGDLNFGDFNGDGTDDLFIGGYGSFNPSKIFYFYRGAKSNYINEVYDGMGKNTQFSFTPLTAGGSVYNKANGFTYPLSEYQQAFYVVDEMATSNGIGGMNSTIYSYEDAILHKQGKGIIGFKKVTSADLVNDRKNVVLYDFNTTFFNLIPVSTISFENSNNNQISTTTFQNTTVSLNGGKSYFNRRDNITSVNHIAEFTKTVNYTYDTYGNITNETTDVNAGAEVTSITNVYIQQGTWIPSRLDNTQTSNTRIGEIAYSRKIKLTYNTFGDIINRTTDVGTTGAVSIDFLNDANTGCPIQSTISSGGLLPKTTSNVYDAKFRHIIKNYNPLNQLTEYTYDAKWSKPLTIKGIDGLITTFHYDSYGKDTYKKTPDANEVQIVYEWVKPNDITGSEPINISSGLYKTTNTETAKAYTSNMYDMFGRVVKKETEGFSNNLFTVYSYDARGRKDQESSIYQTVVGNSYTPLISTYSYNNHNLVEQINITDGSIHQNILKSYTYSNGNTTITQTSPDNKISSTTIDASGLTISASDGGGNLLYEYYSNKKPKSITLNGTQMNYIEYDANANQTKLVDKDAGTTLYNYNNYNLLTSLTDAKGQVFQYNYDVLNRIVTKTNSMGNYTYQYIASGNGINQLLQTTGPNGITETHSYDNLNRPTAFNESVNGNDFITAYEYDQYSNIVKLTYPSGFAIKKEYNNKGYLTTIKRNDNSALIWQQDEMNPLGQESKFTLGNQIQSVYTYDNFGNLNNKSSSGIQDLTLQFNVQNSNLNYRIDNIKGLTENFTYDNMNRLTKSIVVGTSNPIDVSYNLKGNITQKTEGGSTSFHSTKINATKTAENPNADISLIQQDISYTPFNKAQTIIEGDYQYELMYGCNDQRKKTQLYYQGNLLSTKFYSANYEKEITTGSTTETHYINGLNGLCAIYVINNGTGTMYYTYTDHLGSINTITDQSGAIVSEQNFDAWGRKRNPTDWSYAITGSVPAWLQRGFTGHEHLPQFSLINMNGRLYDPILSSMLSPDKYNQQPTFTQNYNRYGYAYNNPLKYTDPSGDLLAIWDVWAIGFVKGAITGLSNGTNWAKGGWNRANKGASNSAKLWGGLFQSDQSNKGNGRNFLEVVSRLTWQAPQTTLGMVYNQGINTVGNVDEIEYFHGATVVYGAAVQGGGMTLGSYISLPGKGDGYEIGIGYDSRTLMHEYGHYLQSKDVGIFYLAKYAIPSLGPLAYIGFNKYEGADWTELDANSRSAKYFENQTNGDFNWKKDITEVSKTKGIYDIYTELPGTKSKLAWYFFK
ncbi:MAG: SpvB/TcaC N-terminal domain-containing protein [Bacteroidota bacterium]